MPAPSLLLGDNYGLVEDGARPALTSNSISGEAALGDGGTSVLLPLPRLDPEQHPSNPFDPSTPIDYEQAWQRLTCHPVPQDELPSLIKTIFSDKRGADMVTRLSGDDAPAFLDIIDEVRLHSRCFQGVGWLTPLSTLRILLIRDWLSLTSHCVSEITA